MKIISSIELKNLNRLLDNEYEENVILGIKIAKSLGIDITKCIHIAHDNNPALRGQFWYNSSVSEEEFLIMAINEVRHSKKLKLSLEDFIEIQGILSPQLNHIVITSFDAQNPKRLNALDSSKIDLIKEVKINRAKLLKIPSFVFEIPNLKKLDLSHNSIKEIPARIIDLNSLEELCLQFNHIEELPEALVGLQSLKILWIAKNRLPKLPNFLLQMHHLENVYIFDSNISVEEIKKYEALMTNCKFYTR